MSDQGSSFLPLYAQALGAAINAHARRDPNATELEEKAAMWADLHNTAKQSRARNTGGRHHAE